MPKKNYIVHYRNLKFYLSMGLQLKYIHRVIEFKQERWLAPYINFNTEKRKLATTDFERNLYKLCNNAVFGKMCEDMRKRIDVKITTYPPQAQRYIAQPNFASFTMINEDATMVKMNKTSILWRKPTYVGFTILELSKLHMYKFHYEHMVPFYTENGRCRAKLLFTDTDSLCYEIQTTDVYADMSKRLDLFDTSDYPPNNPLFSKTNAKVVGKMKDESPGVPPIEFVGLRSKMYSLLLPDNKEKMTAKGIPINHTRKHITHSQYKDCLLKEHQTFAKFHSITSKNHVMRTEEVQKSALSCYDDKRYLLSDSTDTLAYGHHAIPRTKPNKQP